MSKYNMLVEHGTSELDDWCYDNHVTLTLVPSDAEPVDKSWPSRAWTATLEIVDNEENRKLEVPYFTGTAIDSTSPGDVLSSLILDAGATEYASFEEWAADMGWNIDSRHAKRVFNACCEMALRVRQFLGHLFDAAADCEH
jgi:hypothetical protein